MREIIFRGMRKDNGRWIYGCLEQLGELCFIRESEVKPDTVGQFVCFDRKGNRVFEGAEVLVIGTQELDWSYSFDWNETGIVRWNEAEMGFYVDIINKREVNICEDGYFTVDTFPLRQWHEEEWGIEYEVTGTVFEHPHLLEGRDEA